MWTINPTIKNEQFYYYFSEFTLQLNNLQATNLEQDLPRSDSRFRKDIRALENGDIKLS